MTFEGIADEQKSKKNFKRNHPNLHSFEKRVIDQYVDKYTNKFVKDDVCSYIIKTPYSMGQYDKMYVKIYNIEKADIYIAKGKGYMWLNHLDKMVSEGD